MKWVKGEIQGCFLENGSLFAKRLVTESPEWMGRDLTRHKQERSCSEGNEKGRVSGERKNVSSPRQDDRLQMGPEGELQSWALSGFQLGWLGRRGGHLTPVLWEQPQLPPSPPLCLRACSSVFQADCGFIALDFCTPHSFSQQWLLLPRVCLVKYSTFRLLSVVQLKNVSCL